MKKLIAEARAAVNSAKQSFRETLRIDAKAMARVELGRAEQILAARLKVLSEYN